MMANNNLNDFYKKNCKIINTTIIALITLLFIITPLDKTIQSISTDRIYQNNLDYLKSTSDKALLSFGITSGLKIAIAIADRFPILGGAVEPVGDFVDITWGITFIAMVTLKILYFLLFISHSIETTLLITFLILLLISLLVSNYLKQERLSKFLKSLTFFAFTIMLFTWIALPLTVQGAKYLSNITTKSIIDNANKEIAIIEKELSLIKKESSKEVDSKLSKHEQTNKESVVQQEEKSDKSNLDKFKSWVGNIDSNINEVITTTKTQIKSIYQSITDNLSLKSGEILKKIELYTTKLKNEAILLIVGYTLDCFIFPIIFLFIFAKFFKILKEIYIK